MRVKLHVWRQAGPDAEGAMKTYDVADVSADMSFLEMLDVLNNRLVERGQEAIAFDHDCREGICGSCGFMIDGVAHGPRRATSVCQLHMREFEDGAEIWVEPFRAEAFPVVKDLVVDRSAFDRIIAAGGYVSVNTGSAPDANDVPVGKDDASQAFDYAACIGCGACVASCKNASAILFAGAKFSHLDLLPQGKVESDRRALRIVRQMDAEGFGACTNQYECEAVCPKEISATGIARLNRRFVRASLRER